MNRNLCVAAFFVGLITVGWVGLGYVGSNPLALTMTALIGAFYLMGALELQRFHRATSTLSAALAAIPENLTHLNDWLGQVHSSLQSPVRLRIEGERIGLPGPAMTPYLVGLLVLLGMLGTFLGMVVTLNGAVLALESTTDLATIRAALAAPVKGLGLAFGTSVAGVAASAMLGLVSALCRRERLRAAQGLDTSVAASALCVFSRAHQRRETLAAMQFQARVMPEVVASMQAMMAQMERQSQDLNERLLASQDRFHRQAEAAYSGLASSVDRSLKESLTDSARAAGATIRPVVEATMTGIARETALFQERMADTVQIQLDGLATRFGTTVTTLADTWTTALVRHERSSEDLARTLHQSLGRFSETFEQRAASLLTSVEASHAVHRAELEATMSEMVRQSASLLATVDQAHAALQADAASKDQQRLAAWIRALESMAKALEREWQQAGAQTIDQQERICRTLEQTAREVHAQAEAHARNTIAEMSRLIDTAAQAPRAAAEVVGLLRQKLSDSLARDNDLLEERSRIMGTLSHLLDGVDRAATGQRTAIDALVTSSADLLHRVGTQFTEKVEAESAKMTAVASQITGSAVEVSSLGEAFGFAVQMFSESNEALVTQLQRIESALGKSTARSDEQLGYYVAQAREIIDLSISSQRQIVEDLRQLSSRPAPLASEVA